MEGRLQLSPPGRWMGTVSSTVQPRVLKCYVLARVCSYPLGGGRLSIYIWHLFQSIRPTPLYPGNGHGRCLHSFPSFHSFSVCCNPLILHSPFYIIYSSTLSSHYTGGSPCIHKIYHTHLNFLSHHNLWHCQGGELESLNLSTFHSSTLTRHTKYVIHTCMTFTIHSSHTAAIR